ncbi:hypothetical protein COV87_03350 [Candidatus Roizmanbacteria bacterium CG11_big_fil_rev_8_21_14_0_20_37_16]|uniref:Uncharacterized protein n=1 Tax=Candidatus Roizmanbacteria bacterium CG11_big_fil_rev_8_21_14_0_20_37_16 TaxID=1974857 RepID=A0A2H0KJN4_9BACT|nr:MAG: hypothetical protein COV87_03350 [Candidatus Roizmanbacteria bacterium CG11_big_fil_rev_8_21_14_0_20_37_16]
MSIESCKSHIAKEIPEIYILFIIGNVSFIKFPIEIKNDRIQLLICGTHKGKIVFEKKKAIRIY